MKTLLSLVAGLLLGAPAFAQETVDDCGLARDPARCEARQAALKTCASERGAAKRACLEANMPPVDCAKAENPARCEKAQQARVVCKDKTGPELKQCLSEGKPKKSKKALKSGKKKKPVKKPLAKKHAKKKLAKAKAKPAAAY